MSLLKEWNELLNGQDKSTVESFFKEYSEGEKHIYASILKEKKTKLEGVLKELADKFNVRPVIFMGFLDGIQTSLKNTMELETINEDSKINLDIDFEKLYFNMHKAKADYLYELNEWNDVLSEEKRKEIFKSFQQSKIVRKEKTPGRNEPCPCGSGKKYKKCCGKVS